MPRVLRRSFYHWFPAATTSYDNIVTIGEVVVVIIAVDWRAPATPWRRVRNSLLRLPRTVVNLSSVVRLPVVCRRILRVSYNRLVRLVTLDEEAD